MSARPVTLQSLADRLGLSVATISRALRNHPRISKETVERVQRLSRELGYQSDPEMRRLMTHLRYRKQVRDQPIIALMINQRIPFNLYHAENGKSVLMGAFERISESGYRPEVFNIAEYEARGKDIGKTLYSRGISGIVVCPFEKPGPLPRLKREHFSMVAIGHSILTKEIDRAVTNQYQGMLVCFERLMRADYRRIGAILEIRSDRRTNGLYRAAYLLESQRHLHTPIPALMLDAFNPEPWQREIQSWYTRFKPDAIISSETFLPLVCDWLEGEGVKVPKEVGAACLHITPGAGRFSGLLQNSLLVGKAAVDALVNLMHNYETGIPPAARTILVEGEWFEGRTIRPHL